MCIRDSRSQRGEPRICADGPAGETGTGVGPIVDKIVTRYQISRADNCMVRGVFTPEKVLTVPSLPAEKLLPGVLNTLKKSACTRSLTLSLMAKLLKIAESTFHRFVARIGWLI